MSTLPNMPLLRLIQARCREDRNTGCWLWSGSLNGKGYANTIAWPVELGGDGRTRNAHVLAYIGLKGQVPPGMELDHLCRRKDCANPYHLEPITSSENKRRRRIGEARPLSAFWFPSPSVEYPLLTASSTGLGIAGLGRT